MLRVQPATYTSFISEELFSSVTRLSTLPGSGLKQGWSGFRVLPSSGMHVCSHVSKKGVSPDGLGSDRITWNWETQSEHTLNNNRTFYSWPFVFLNKTNNNDKNLNLYGYELTSDPYVCTTWQSMRKEMSKSSARTEADLAGKEKHPQHYYYN